MTACPARSYCFHGNARTGPPNCSIRRLSARARTGVSKLWGRAKGPQTPRSAGEPAVPIHRWTQDLLLPASGSCTQQPGQVTAEHLCTETSVGRQICTLASPTLKDGVQRDQSGWGHCVSIPLVRPDTFHMLAQWDQYLEQFSEGSTWDPVWHKFHEDDHNCFSFCLQFLNSILAMEGRSLLSREDFTRSFILPRMRRVSKYTTLIRHLQKHQYYMVDRQETETQGERQDKSALTS
ncbi:uncharacterized protein LOC124857385 isoform X3 [Girardinichthys multiradiatus]|uniref:uncharacterized protein LOC124857385 isoform X3 n=1 Tax=Girardinichthys multiradiatus TaxID=208333 RepID=UPI001FABCE2A|nr:uncharacterized protein LOC124857385 isoform X3 [Girardinichthys multiradiatus]